MRPLHASMRGKLNPIHVNQQEANISMFRHVDQIACDG
jgi:hypothetical protein